MHYFDYLKKKNYKELKISKITLLTTGDLTGPNKEINRKLGPNKKYIELNLNKITTLVAQYQCMHFVEIFMLNNMHFFRSK